MPPKRDHNIAKTHNKNSKEAVVVNAMADCVLPDDMMQNILTRLPVKSLVRFKSVCKPWNSLFSTPEFIKIHYNRFSQAPKTCSLQSHLLECPVLGIGPTKKTLTLADLVNPHETFLDSCKGLVCIARPSFTTQVVLWNPATHLWKTLPRSKTYFGAPELVSVGFGCNDEGDDYKVVRIFSLKTKVCVEVYSSKSDSWKTVQVGFKITVFDSTNHVIANGNPYWLAELDDTSKSDEERRGLLWFDATKMEFKFVLLPKIKGGGTFVNWRDSLAVLVTVKRDGDWLESIHVWVYDDGEKIWRKKMFGRGLKLQVDKCTDCSRNGKIIGVCMDGKMFVYDTNKDCVDVSESVGFAFGAFPFDESLGYVEGMKPMVVKKKEFKEGDLSHNIQGFFVFSMPPFSGEIGCYYPLAF